MNIHFTKMHSLGNDFVVIDDTHAHVVFNPNQIKNLASRHCGIGFDQLLLLEKSEHPEADFFVKIFNSDGFEVEQCGNGLRAIGAFIKQQALHPKSELTLATHAGLFPVTVHSLSDVTVNLGKPRLQSIELPGVLCTVDLGNPHAVMQFDDITEIDIDSIGKNLNRHPDFPEGVNVEFMQILSREHIHLRVFERGVGETQACGSGACASVAAGIYRNVLDHHVKVELPGGEMTVDYKGDCLSLKGPVSFVFEGKFNLSFD